IQVEHAVTEEVYGLDLIEWQLRIAVGERLDIAARPAGHAIEARLYAEHPVTFLPQAGTIRGLCLPSAIRVDTGVEAGDSVSLAYDPLIAKLVAHGEDRAAALQLLVDALLATRVEGLMTNRALLLWVLRHDVMRAGLQTTAFLTRYPPLGRSRPAPPAWQGSFRLNGGSQQGPAFPPSPPTVESARHRLDAVAGGSGDVTAPMPGTVLQVLVSEGERVEPKQRLLVLEAMKMETPVTAPRRGAVERVAVSEGEQVSRGQLLVALAST
ncbi:MAG: biotin/lipoyl-containing protein, partial [Gaiellales bacterium]